MIWCEHCRDHYDRDHYDQDGAHWAGSEFGPTGETMEAERCPDCRPCARHAITDEPDGAE